MGHKDKERILDIAYKKKVFLPLADVAATILINDRIIGTWKYKKGRKTPSFQIKLFNKKYNEKTKIIKSEIQRMSKFLEIKKYELKLQVDN